MQLVNWAIIIFIFSGIGAWTLRMRTHGAGMIGACGCLLAGSLGLYGAGACLLTRTFESGRTPWNAPYASLHLGLDSLSAAFLLPLFAVGALAALAAMRRLPGDYAANRPHEHWLFFNLTLASAALAVVARNAVLFLFAWETMTVASFLLIENDQRAPGAKSGGWVYLTAGHIGGACLLALFALLGAESGSLDFNALKASGFALPAAFVLAYLGFGGKVGLFPFHAWYPEGYPPAPAHVGAVLSGVVGNLGIYGLLRVLLLLGGEAAPPPAWWGYLLLLSGLGSALFGAARALASRDLSRLLAWSSVENFGLMAAGLGLGLLGAASGNGVVSYLGFAAAILHMLNHSVAKALLFLSAGTVYARAGVRDLDRMGGLLKKLPVTGLLFLVGALGAAAVAPLNGFAGEFLLLMSAYNGAVGYSPASVGSASMFLAVVVLAVAGGLAVAAYMKGFGFVFLGNPRGAGAASKTRERTRNLVPHCLLAAAAVGLAIFSPRVIAVISPISEALVKLWRQSPTGNLDLELWLSARGADVLDSASIGSLLLLALLAAVWLLRLALMRGKRPETGPTWDCGYAAPTNRMQYTAASFSRPLTENFRSFVGLKDDRAEPSGPFPGDASFSSSTPDIGKAAGFSQLFRLVEGLAARLRALQEGRVQLYLLYMAATLVALLLWKL